MKMMSAVRNANFVSIENGGKLVGLPGLEPGTKAL